MSIIIGNTLYLLRKMNLKFGRFLAISVTTIKFSAVTVHLKAETSSNTRSAPQKHNGTVAQQVLTNPHPDALFSAGDCRQLNFNARLFSCFVMFYWFSDWWNWFWAIFGFSIRFLIIFLAQQQVYHGWTYFGCSAGENRVAFLENSSRPCFWLYWASGA